MDFIEITEEPLKVDEISAQVTDKCTGATSLFIGTTRDNFDGKKVIKLEYEAYTPMAKKKLKELCNRLRVKWEDLYHIAIYHRLGEVGPCEASVIIAISSAHRCVKRVLAIKKLFQLKWYFVSKIVLNYCEKTKCSIAKLF